MRGKKGPDGGETRAGRGEAGRALLLHQTLHALEHRDDCPQETVHAPVQQQRRGVAHCVVCAVLCTLSDPDPCTVLLGILPVLVLALAPEGVFERDGETNGEAGEADGEVRAAAEVEVGKLAERALDFEQAGKLVV